MNEVLAQFRPQISTSMQSQITEYLRDLIIRGGISAGTKLPTTQELSKAWGTHPPAIHAAMATLVKEGLVVRSMGRGTFVRGHNESLRKVALYISGDSWMRQANNFAGHLVHILASQLAAGGTHAQPWISRRPEALAGQPWADLELAAKRREIQGVIVLATDQREAAWLEKLPVPVAFLTSMPLRNHVSMCLGDAVKQSMAHLAGCGCRSIGLITVLSHLNQHANGGKAESAECQAAEFFDQFLQLAGDHQLQVRDSWIYSPSEWMPEKSAAKFGYESFHALWNQPEKPDSLFVHTDIAAQGVLLALGQRHVSVPNELHLVLHRNVEMGLFCPVPASFIDVSVQNVAAALVDLLQRIHRGETVEPPVRVEATYVAESAAAESDVLETAALAG